MVDWVLTNTSVGREISKIEPVALEDTTLFALRNVQNASRIKKTKEFLRSLGAPVLENVFMIANGGLLANGKGLTGLSTREEKLLTLLIENSNKVTTIDQIGEVYFESYDEFSLYAISKAVQRIRDKLSESGLSSGFVQTFRGQGYMLRN